MVKHDNVCKLLSHTKSVSLNNMEIHLSFKGARYQYFKTRCATIFLKLPQSACVCVCVCVCCHATVGPPLQEVPGPSTTIFVAMDDLPGPSIAVTDGPPLLQVILQYFSAFYNF